MLPDAVEVASLVRYVPAANDAKATLHRALTISSFEVTSSIRFKFIPICSPDCRAKTASPMLKQHRLRPVWAIIAATKCG